MYLVGHQTLLSFVHMMYVLKLSAVFSFSEEWLLFFVVVMQHDSGTTLADNTASVEFSLDASSKSATNLMMSRPRPVTVPVHSVAADHRTFQQLVSSYMLCTVYSLHDILCHVIECTCLIPVVLVYKCITADVVAFYTVH